MLFKILKILFIFIFSVSLWAEAGGGGEGSSEGEAAAEEGGEEKAEKPTESAVEKKIPEEEDWAKQVTVLNTKEGKVKAYVKEIQSLVKKKQAATTKEEKRTLIDSMIQAHSNLRKEAGEYNKMRNKLKYRFPNKGAVTERRYLPMRIQSLEKMEQEVGIDAKLTLIRKKINNKYKPYISKELHSKQDKGHKKYEVEKRGLDKKITIER